MSNMKVSKRDIVAIVSSLGVIAWLMTHFFGGLILFSVVFGYIIVPFLLVYLYSIIDVLIGFRYGLKRNRTKIFAHACVIFTILLIYIDTSETFKSRVIYSCELIDDLSRFDLKLRENGRFDNTVSGMFGYYEDYSGRYIQEGDYIIFKDRPYDNDFLPDTMLLDTTQNALFITRKKDGSFNKEKEWLNHFKIVK
ncbi:hypothetical protein EYV94_02510 [Puteibacter caeruleilacunae]|nr:hypothetical protein EYV94_02510 [Puteibacter caeruleilacunae]